jgi:hypothetical protein
MVLETGLVTRLFETSEVFHVYVLAPKAVSVAELPTQSAVGLQTAEIIGSGFMLTLTIARVMQPRVVVVVTV